MVTIRLEFQANDLTDETVEYYRTSLNRILDSSVETITREGGVAILTVRGQSERELDEGTLKMLHYVLSGLPPLRLSLQRGDLTPMTVQLRMPLSKALVIWETLLPVFGLPDFYVVLTRDGEGGVPEVLPSSDAMTYALGEGTVLLDRMPLPFDRVVQLDDPVEEWPLSVRSLNALANNRERTRGELISMTDAELLRTPAFGRKSLNEVKEYLARDGWKLGSELLNWRPRRRETEVPNLEGITINGEVATDLQVAVLNVVLYGNSYSVSSRAENKPYFYGDVLVRNIPVKDSKQRDFRLTLMNHRLLPTDKVEGWASQVEVSGQPVTENQLRGLNLKCSELFPAPSLLLDLIRERDLGDYVGDVINIADLAWGRIIDPEDNRSWRVKQAMADFNRRLERYDLRVGATVIGWFAPETATET